MLSSITDHVSPRGSSHAPRRHDIPRQPSTHPCLSSPNGRSPYVSSCHPSPLQHPRDDFPLPHTRTFNSSRCRPRLRLLYAPAHQYPSGYTQIPPPSSAAADTQRYRSGTPRQVNSLRLIQHRFPGDVSYRGTAHAPPRSPFLHLSFDHPDHSRSYFSSFSPHGVGVMLYHTHTSPSRVRDKRNAIRLTRKKPSPWILAPASTRLCGIQIPSHLALLLSTPMSYIPVRGEGGIFHRPGYVHSPIPLINHTATQPISHVHRNS